MMKFADVHAHLESSRFKKDLDKVIADSEKKGVKLILNSGTTPERNRKALELSRKYKIVRPCFGLYPVGNFSKDIDGEIKWIIEHRDECVAIGEIGLDFQEDRKENFVKQKGLFLKMLNLAVELDKPVIIHSRGAEKEAIEMLEKYPGLKIVMHCFCGDSSLIKRAVKNGWYFSVPPAIMRWENFKELVEIVPIGQLLTETDSPYLAPLAGERNEPANVEITLQEIAKIKCLKKEEVAEKIWINTEKIFCL
jgi:TatD DNase family protein